MWREIKLSSIIFLLVILEVSFFPGLTSGKIIPDLALVLVILWSVRKRFEEIWLWIFFIGLFLDLATFEKVGVNVISLIIISYLISFLNEKFFISQRHATFLILISLVIGGTFANWTAVNLLSNFFKSYSLSLLGLKIVSNLAILFIFYPLMARTKELFGINESRLTIK